MANRLFDNVIIIDSAMGNLPAVGGTSSNISNYNVTAIAFWAVSTLGNVVLTGANTGTDIITQFNFVNHLGSSLIASQQNITFGTPLRLSALKVPTLAAGTAWIYLV